MPDQPGVQVCEECGRRVPRTVAVCHGGAPLAKGNESGTSDGPPTPSGSLARSVLAAAFGVAAVVFAFTRVGIGSALGTRRNAPTRGIVGGPGKRVRTHRLDYPGWER